jgi:hypothetical protein
MDRSRQDHSRRSLRHVCQVNRLWQTLPIGGFA